MAEMYQLDAGSTLTDMTAGGAAKGSYCLNLCNRGNTLAIVRVALTKGGAASVASYIEFDTQIEANGSLSRWPIALDAGWKVYVSSTGSVSAVLNGDTP